MPPLPPVTPSHAVPPTPPLPLLPHNRLVSSPINSRTTPAIIPSDTTEWDPLMVSPRRIDPFYTPSSPHMLKLPAIDLNPAAAPAVGVFPVTYVAAPAVAAAAAKKKRERRNSEPPEMSGLPVVKTEANRQHLMRLGEGRQPIVKTGQGRQQLVKKRKMQSFVPASSAAAASVASAAATITTEALATVTKTTTTTTNALTTTTTQALPTNTTTIKALITTKRTTTIKKTTKTRVSAAAYAASAATASLIELYRVHISPVNRRGMSILHTKLPYIGERILLDLDLEDGGVMGVAEMERLIDGGAEREDWRRLESVEKDREVGGRCRFMVRFVEWD